MPYFKKTSRQYEKTYKYTSELLTYYIYVRQGKLNNEEFDPGSG